jgi:ubiquinone/menaquinone biosynthesis C-methylase UbiE
MLSLAARRFRRACSQGRLRLHSGSLTDLPLADAQIDALITVNTIYFVPDLDRAFAELSRVLKASGRVVIGLGDPDAMEHAAGQRGVPTSVNRLPLPPRRVSRRPIALGRRR